MKYLRIGVGAVIILATVANSNLHAQSEKQVLDLEAAKTWRSHSSTLSNDGNWYTVLYSLIEKPDPKEDVKKDSINAQDSLFKSYGENIQTDVLYICNAKTGVEHSIIKGSRPVFSINSEWIAYQITLKADPKKKEKEKTITELRNLKSGITRQYESSARFQFPEDTDLFISSDATTLLIYNLNTQEEHFIGNIGGFIVDKKANYIAYTISSKDMRGNGIYIYDPDRKTTQTLLTGNYIYTDLSWNPARNSLAAFRHKKTEKDIDFLSLGIVTIKGIGSKKLNTDQFDLSNISGLPQMMGFNISSSGSSSNITWLNNIERLLIKIHEYPDKDKKDSSTKKDEALETTVSVWHWKDEKLLSQQMKEAERKKYEIYDALVFLKTDQAIQLTDEEMQRIRMSRDTDNWAVGTDDRAYISDWDISRNDLYRVNLLTGKKSLIEKGYDGSMDISPDGEKMILWQDGHYWCYDFEEDKKHNITAHLDVSFVNQENDHWGRQPSYGFVAWVKGQDAVLLNHKLDLWLVPLDPKTEAVNLTQPKNGSSSIRFRLGDMSFRSKSEIADRYLDLKSPLILSAFDTKAKHAGFYKLNNRKLTSLIFEPASFSASRFGGGITKAKNSDAILFKKGDFRSYPETYISDVNFSELKKVTSTNPHQEKYLWGHRILIDYTNDDGVPLQGVLSIPDTYQKGQKLPMVVYSYEKLSDSRYSYPTPSIGGARICEMMYVSDGYLVLQPDIHFNVGTPHSDMHECLDAAIEKVIELGYVDEKAVGYEGFSYGGHTGMYVSTQENRFAAIAAGAGVSNLVQGFNIDIVGDGSNEQDYYMVGQGRLGTDPATSTGMYIRESAVFNATTMNTPLLLFHGTVDNVVQWEHSFGYYSILRYLKKPVVFLSYHGEGHGLRQKANREDIQNRLKEYFDHYLKGKEASDWITEGIPYKAKETKKDSKEEAKATLPNWK